MAPRDETRKPSTRWLLLALVLLFPLAYVGEALVDGELVLVGGDCLEVDPPWRDSGVRPWNPELGDHALAFIPYHSFLTDELRDRGHLPYWNPYQFCGSPCLGNPQFGHWSPFGWLPHGLPRPDGRPLGLTGYELGAWVRLVLGAAFAFLLARALGTSRIAASVTALAFGYGGYQILWLNFPLAHVSTFLPMVLFGLTRGIQTSSRGYFALAGCAFALAVLAGHPETAFFCGAFAGVWVLALTIGPAIVQARASSVGGGSNILRRVLRELKASKHLSALCHGLLALAAGSLVGTLSLLPFLEYLDQSLVSSERTALPMHREPFPGSGAKYLVLLAPCVGAFVGVGLLASATRTTWRLVGAFLSGTCSWVLLHMAGPDLDLLPQFLVDPDWQGHPVHGMFRGQRTFLESNLLYVGVIALVLAFIGATSRRGFRGRLACVATAFAALVGMLQLPPWIQLIDAIPVLNLAEPSRAACVGSLALAILAGFGLDRLVGADGTRPEGLPLLAVAIFAGFAWFLPVRGEHPLALEPEGPDAAWLTPVDQVQLAAADAFDLRLAWEREGPVRATYRIVNLEDPQQERQGLLIDSNNVRGAKGPRTLFAFQDARFLPVGSWQVSAFVESPRGAFDAHWIPGPRFHVGRETFETTHWGRWQILVALLTCGLVFVCSRRPSFGPRVGVAAVIVLAVDLYAFGHDWNGTSRKALVYRASPSFDFLRDQLQRAREEGRGEFRIWTSSEILKGSSATGVRLRDLEGYDAIEVGHYRLLYRQLLTLDVFRVGLHEGASNPTALSIANFPVSSPMARAMGVRFVLDTRRFPDRVLKARGLRLAFPRPVDPDAEPVDGIWIYEVVGATGMRAYLAHKVVTTGDGTREYFGALAQTDVEDPAHPGRGEISYVDHPEDNVLLDPEVELAPLDPPFTQGRVRFLSDEPDRVELAIDDLDGDAYLVLTDTDFPGWSATIDGRPAAVHRAFLAFRVVRLPAGAQRVTFHYEPPSLQRAQGAAWIGVGLLLYLMFAGVLDLVRRRRA